MEDWTDRLELLNSEIVACRKCPRLVAWREATARTKRRAYLAWDYWGKPITGFGDILGPVLVVGLAPGAHGANRTGRIFTGDSSGDFLFGALYRAGFANLPSSHSIDDGLVVKSLFISAACRCPPPDNKPTPEEIRTCLPYLQREIALMRELKGIVVLGRIAFDSVLRIYRDKGWAMSNLEFSHGAFHRLGTNHPWLLASYHPSRQNTQTGRLTQAMFDDIWEKVKSLI